MKLSGNTILITGGSSGIGLELAKTFLTLKNKVIITGRDASKLAHVKEQYPEMEICVCELTDFVSLGKLVLFIEQNYNDLNVLINNAGIQYNYSFLEEQDPIPKIDQEILTNLSAPIKLTTLLLPILLKNRLGAVVNVSSGLFLAPKKSASVYCATKAAIHIYSKTLRYQLEGTGIRVFEIIPPLVETAMTEGRGRSKITPKQLVNEFLKKLKTDKYESYIGKAKLLKLVNHVLPRLADRMMKNGS